MADCDNFSPALFVASREPYVNELFEWAIAPDVGGRVWIIEAAPGYGKTWVLCRLEQRLRDEGIHGKNLFVVRVPAKQLTSGPDKNAWRKAILEWLAEKITEVKKFRPTIRDHDPDAEPEANIVSLRNQLCRQPVLPPLLIIDAFDEVEDDERRSILERSLLEPFWLDNNCAKIIIAYRDQFKFRSSSLKNDREPDSISPLEIFARSDGEEQLHRLTVELSIANLIIPHDLPTILPYEWNHPKINSCLFTILHAKVTKSEMAKLTADDLRACWLGLIEERAKAEKLLLSRIEQDLKAIVKMKRWTHEEFHDVCEYSTLAETLRAIDALRKLSLVLYLTGLENQVIDGVREIICAELELRRKPATPAPSQRLA